MTTNLSSSINEAVGLVEVFGRETAAKKMGVSEDTVRRYLTEAKLRGIYIGDQKDIPEEFYSVPRKPLLIKGDVMVVGDIHCPTIDYEFAMLIPKVAKKYKIKQLIIAGDFFNMDCFSSYANLVGGPTWKEEKDAFRKLMTIFQKSFKKIYVILGNHEHRLLRWLGGEFGEGDIKDLFFGKDSNVEFSLLSYCWLEDSGSGPWLVAHQKNYSVNQLKVAGDLANKYQANVISHHEHHFGIGWDKWKRYVVVNNGGLFDPSKIDYVSMVPNTMPRMVKGFTILKNGCPYLFGQYPFTDWKKVL